MQKLTAINAMLAAIAQNPVNTPESRNPYSIAAVSVLDRISTEMQEIGWWFNTNTNVTLRPNSEGFILIPSRTLKITDKNNRMNFVIRGSRLYDPLNNTSKFSQDLLVDIVVELDFDTMPEVAAQAVMRSAVHQFFLDRDGEANKVQFLGQSAVLAWSRLNGEGLYQTGASMAMSREFQHFTGRLGGGKTGMAIRNLNRVRRF